MAQPSAQTITWLHLSDLHLKRGDDYDANIVLQALLADIAERERQDGLRPDFIVLTGDVAFAGRPEEYTLACRFLDELLKTTGVARDRLFVVPGNHDVDRDAISTLAAGAASILADRSAVGRFLASDGDRALILLRLHAYRDFINGYLGTELPFDDARYFFAKRFQVSQKQVAVLGLNSAWLSFGGDRDRNRLLLGERQVRAALAATEGADLRLAVMHHPFDWLQDFDRADVEAMLLDRCDFILHGHMHQVGLLQAQTPDSTAMVIAAGAAYETREYHNAYNWVRLDLRAGQGTIYLREYSDRRGGFWTSDTRNYRNAPSGIYTFPLRGQVLAAAAAATPQAPAGSAGKAGPAGGAPATPTAGPTYIINTAGGAVFMGQVDVEGNLVGRDQVAGPATTPAGQPAAGGSAPAATPAGQSAAGGSAPTAGSGGEAGGGEYDIAAVRELLRSAFDAAELQRLCRDHTALRSLKSHFGPGFSLEDTIDEVIDYCDTRLLFPELLAAVKAANPRQYARFEGRLLPR